jgi:multiple sugar transport system ATP-binding protein
VTTVYVTHDQTEAMTLGQRVAVMRDGRILQADEPQTLYRHPVDLFVAAFIGTPAMNLVEARIDGDDVVFGQFRVPLDPRRRPPREARSVILGLRPESFEDSAFAPPEIPRIEAEIDVLEELGSDVHVFFHVDAPRISAEALVEESEDDATLLVEEKALFNARVDPRTRATIGSRLRLAVDPHRFHFFDPKTGRSLLAAEPAPEPEVVLAT